MAPYTTSHISRYKRDDDILNLFPRLGNSGLCLYLSLLLLDRCWSLSQRCLLHTKELSDLPGADTDTPRASQREGEFFKDNFIQIGNIK